MDIEIIVIGESGKWVLNHPRIRIGLDPNCEVSMPPGKFPTVAGEHVVLETVNGAVSLTRETPPGGETFLNGHPAVAGAAIRSGDILRLGAGGPEIRIRLLERETYAPTATHQPTSVLNHEPTRIVTGPAAVAYSPSPPVAPAAVGRQGYTAEVIRGASAAPQNPVPQPAASAAEGEDMSIVEGKVKSLQGIVVVCLVMILVLLGCNIWQSWELYQTRDEVQQMHAQAQNAVAQFTPALDARLSIFEQRMDGMDAKIADAQDRMVKTMDAQTKHEEDRMVERMNAAIPAMLDKYIANKMAEIRR
ncbi:MAG: hypothetical protein ACLPXT_07715 [Terracidiphilus sp.]